MIIQKFMRPTLPVACLLLGPGTAFAAEHLVVAITFGKQEYVVTGAAIASIISLAGIDEIVTAKSVDRIFKVGSGQYIVEGRACYYIAGGITCESLVDDSIRSGST